MNPPLPPPLPPQAPAAVSGGAKKSTPIVLIVVIACAVLCVPVLAILAGMLLPALAKAKQKQQSMMCVNNLKNIGLGVRIFAVDHDDKWPSSWTQITNELTTPRLLVCPADKHVTAAKSWDEFSEANSSYRYLGAGGNDSQTNRVIAICPVHGHLVMADGSVQMGRRGVKFPLEERDGGTYLDLRQ